jgi:hypothetical protein
MNIYKTLKISLACTFLSLLYVISWCSRPNTPGWQRLLRLTPEEIAAEKEAHAQRAAQRKAYAALIAQQKAQERKKKITSIAKQKQAQGPEITF